MASLLAAPRLDVSSSTPGPKARVSPERQSAAEVATPKASKNARRLMGSRPRGTDSGSFASRPLDIVPFLRRTRRALAPRWKTSLDSACDQSSCKRSTSSRDRSASAPTTAQVASAVRRAAIPSWATRATLPGDTTLTRSDGITFGRLGSSHRRSEEVPLLATGLCWWARARPRCCRR